MSDQVVAEFAKAIVARVKETVDGGKPFVFSVRGARGELNRGSDGKFDDDTGLADLIRERAETVESGIASKAVDAAIKELTSQGYVGLNLPFKSLVIPGVVSRQIIFSKERVAIPADTIPNLRAYQAGRPDKITQAKGVLARMLAQEASGIWPGKG